MGLELMGLTLMSSNCSVLLDAGYKGEGPLVLMPSNGRLVVVSRRNATGLALVLDIIYRAF